MRAGIQKKWLFSYKFATTDVWFRGQFPSSLDLDSILSIVHFQINFYIRSVNQLFQSSVSPSLLGDNVSYPLQVGRVALVDRQADDLGHFVRMVRAAEDNDRQQQLKPYCLIECCEWGWRLEWTYRTYSARAGTLELLVLIIYTGKRETGSVLFIPWCRNRI